MTNSEKLAKTLKAAKINVSNVKVLGSYVHIDTYKKYEAALLDMMTRAGFRLNSVRDGVHMDDYVGFRMVFKLP